MRVGWSLFGLASACSFSPGPYMASGDANPEALPIDADVTVGWSTPVKIAEIEHAAGNDDPSLTDDLLQIYFGSFRAGGEEDIWFATRNSVTEPFGEPQPALMLNTAFAETTARITGDGKAIYFASNRVGNNFDTYVATRAAPDQDWGAPVRVAELSSANGDWGPFAQDDQLRVILCSGPSVAQEALYVATRANTASPWGTPVRVAELDESGISECDPIEPRSNVVYYGSSYLNADGTFDIFRASKVSSTAPYGNRTPLSINMPGITDRDPWVSADERTLVFASDRDLVNTQIYISTR